MKIKTTEEIIDTEQCNKGIYTHISDKKWVAVDDLKELIRRNKMDEDELKWNKCHPDWNKSLLLIENALCEEDKEE